MSDIAIRVQNLSKQYKIGVKGHDRLKDLLTHSLRSLFSRNSKSPIRNSQSASPNSKSQIRNSQSDFIWALKDVSFEVKQGETLGIIGPNGAGKSTLLKILSRITEPTSGRAQIYGRVGSLLEVGTGFDRELTGGENIYLNGSILGMKKAEIERKFDEIVDFSGVEKFIDTPVKHYSSGMYVRLAFSVAAHLEPEILVVDEVLAVGDAAFQKKCLGKMEDVARAGRTVLFVSHNMAPVEHLCHKGIMLQEGKLAFSGGCKEAIDYYLHSVSGEGRASSSHIVDLSNAVGRPSRCGPMLRRLELYTDEGRPLTSGMRIGASLKTFIHFRLENPTSNVEALLGFDNSLGQRVFTAYSAFQPGRPQGMRFGDQTYVCEIPSLTLVPGTYKIKVEVQVSNSEVDLVEDATRITIVESDYFGTGKIPWNGFFVLNHHWYLNQNL